MDRFRYKAKKAKQAQSRLKALGKLKTISLPKERALKKILFPAPEVLASPLVSIEDGSTGYNNKAVLTKLNLRIDYDDKIALLGKNGEMRLFIPPISKLTFGQQFWLEASKPS